MIRLSRRIAWVVLLFCVALCTQIMPQSIAASDEGGTNNLSYRGDLAQYRFRKGDVYTYHVIYMTHMMKKEKQEPRYHIEGEVSVSCKGEVNGRFLLDLSAKLQSYSTLGKAVSVRREYSPSFAASIGSLGDLEFDSDLLDGELEKGPVPEAYARMFRAIAVIFPSLPSGWTASIVKGREHAWTYSYAVCQPLVIRALDASRGDGDGLNTEIVSSFDKGLVQSGQMRWWWGQGDAKRLQTVMDVRKEKLKTGVTHEK